MRTPKNNIEGYWESVKRIILESDLVLEILDARLIELSRNEEVERLIQEIGRPKIFVINKSDLVSRDSLKKSAQLLKKEAEVVFISTKQKGSSKILLYTIKKVFKKYGKREEFNQGFGAPKLKYREARANIVVGVLGYPNVGKSSIINRIAYKRKTPVSKKAGTTHGVHWITANKDIKFIDTPGVIPLVKEDEIRYGLIGARDADRLNNPELVADSLIKMFIKKNKLKNILEKYNLQIEEINPDHIEEIIEKIGEKRGFLLKAGEIDINRASMILIRDWQRGELKI
jgi:hypothetical protein